MMVPKPNTASASKQPSSSSLDLYNRTHDFVLHRTPDQSATFKYVHDAMRVAIASICLEIGWNTAHVSALDVLVDVSGKFLQQIGKQSKKYAEHYGRTQVSEDDIILGFRDMGISVSELEEYVQNFDPVNGMKEVKYFPTPRKTELNFLRPGSDEVITRPNHVHEYMPPMMIEEKGEEGKEEEVQDGEGEDAKVKQTSPENDGSQNELMPFVLEEQVPDVGSELVVSEVICEEVEVKTEGEARAGEGAENELVSGKEEEHDIGEESSDDEIEPGLKTATMFATFKSTKKLGTRGESIAIKRFRKILEEHGHPKREVKSVIMTREGFISPFTIGHLPDTKTPAGREFDNLPVLPEKKRRIPTMKKILEGVKKLEKGGMHDDSGDENVDDPGLFGVMDKIVTTGGEGASLIGHNGAIKDKTGIPKKKLSKEERKLLHQKKKEKKLKLKAKSKEKQLLKLAKANLHASGSKDLDFGSSKNKLKIFTKKLKAGRSDASGGSISKKKKKDKKNKSRPKELRIALDRIDDLKPGALGIAPPAETEMIESDEDFSNIPEDRVVSPVHILNPSASYSADLPMIQRKKMKRDALHPPIRAKLKRPLGLPSGDHPPMKKKRGRPKKILGGIPNVMGMGAPPGGPMSLPAAQLADIGAKLMMKEPQLNVMKIRKEHMEVQDLLMDLVPRPPTFTTKPPTISPSKGIMPPLISADLLRRLPAQPGLIPEAVSMPPARLSKEMSSSISVTPSHSSPQKDITSAASNRNLASNMCSSVTITRIEMNPQKLPSRYDDAVTPGIGPPPGMESPIKRGKFGKPPPLLQIPVATETESGITITPIVMGGGAGAGTQGGNKEHKYDHPLPPPPPLQERPQKQSLLAKLDEELSSTSSTSSRELKKKEKEKRKELRKEKKKKTKDKSKDKSERKKKKKEKSGESGASDKGEHQIQATVPKLTLKLGGHSNTPTPVDSPNSPRAYHEPPMPGMPGMPLPTKKLTFRGLHPEQELPKPPMQQGFASDDDLQVAKFAALVTRPLKPPRAAKAHAAAAVAAMGLQQSFPVMKESFSGGNKRGRGRPPKGNEAGFQKVATPTSSKQAKSSLTVLETETVGCIIDDQGNKIWICPACGRQDDGSPMIGCDICDDWYHFTCVGITEDPKEEDQWFCQRCKKKQKEGKQKKRK